MSTEKKTLKEWMGQATRGDGRKFTQESWPWDQSFEPIFLAANRWHGVFNCGESGNFTSHSAWYEWTPPKKRKMVVFRAPIFRESNGEECIGLHYRNTTEEEIRKYYSRANIVGFSEREEWVDE